MVLISGSHKIKNKRNKIYFLNLKFILFVIYMRKADVYCFNYIITIILIVLITKYKITHFMLLLLN